MIVGGTDREEHNVHGRYCNVKVKQISTHSYIFRYVWVKLNAMIILFARVQWVEIYFKGEDQIKTKGIDGGRRKLTNQNIVW